MKKEFFTRYFFPDSKRYFFPENIFKIFPSNIRYISCFYYFYTILKINNIKEKKGLQVLMKNQLFYRHYQETGL